MGNKTQESSPFIKYHAGLSFFFNPAEMVFALQMANYEYLKQNGYRINLSKAEYARRMGMKEYTFEKCVMRFIDLKMLSRTYNKTGNMVYYSFDMELYGKLIHIVATARGKRLSSFFERIKKEKRSIDGITEEEILALNG
jgi:hypothetical protein